MDKDNKNGYLSDAELRRLISETEKTDMVKAPDYLEAQILKEAGISYKTVIVLDQKTRLEYKKKELKRYTMQVMLAAVASIAILIAMPSTVHIEQAFQIEKQQTKKVMKQKDIFGMSTKQAITEKTEEANQFLDHLFSGQKED